MGIVMLVKALSNFRHEIGDNFAVLCSHLGVSLEWLSAEENHQSHYRKKIILH